jgi:outer membrane scaffolding protein for murein synthesis (MipA/OmpV family)
LRLYDAQAGIKDAFLAASAEIPIDARWTFRVMGRYTHLLGEARHSPLVETNHQLFGGIGLTYRFNLN